MATGDLRIPFAELETAALCRGDGPDPFEKGLEVPLELLLSPSARILEPCRLRFERWSLSAGSTFTEPLGLP